jgi:hypothetical protein
MKAIARCKDEYIKIRFPKTLEQCQQLAEGFASISTNGCIDRCVAAVDGYLLAINAPPKVQGKNVKSFFSGHYHKYGVNIQAACDHQSRFLFIALAGPGVMGDREACRECNLYDLIESLPGEYCAIGDCAYKPTPMHMVPIYGGNQAKIKENDTFNFFASQLRIRIEMAFGMMAKKWGILQRPVSVPLKKLKWLVISIATLHNFCINERLKDGETNIQNRNSTISSDEVLLEEEVVRLRDDFAELEYRTYRDSDAVRAGRVGISDNREKIKRKIIALKLERPMGNHSKAV